MDTKWFQFDQNNSGGTFIVDDQVTHRLFIEAVNEEEATEKATALGVYFDGCSTGMDCPCCGDRWYDCDELTFPIDYDKDLVFTSVESFAQFLADRCGWCKPDAYIYYANGTKNSIFKSEK